MNFSEAMQMLGTKLQGKYGHLGFKYKKSDKTLTRHSKNFTYMIAFSSFGGNTKESISLTTRASRKALSARILLSASLLSWIEGWESAACWLWRNPWSRSWTGCGPSM